MQLFAIQVDPQMCDKGTHLSTKHVDKEVF